MAITVKSRVWYWMLVYCLTRTYLSQQLLRKNYIPLFFTETCIYCHHKYHTKIKKMWWDFCFPLPSFVTYYSQISYSVYVRSYACRPWSVSVHIHKDLRIGLFSFSWQFCREKEHKLSVFYSAVFKQVTLP